MFTFDCHLERGLISVEKVLLFIMKLLVDFAKLFVCNMSIDLGCGNRSVAKHGLN